MSHSIDTNSVRQAVKQGQADYRRKRTATKGTIAQQVKADLKHWQKAAEGGYCELYRFAKAKGFDTRGRFPRVKAALLTHDIDYEALRESGKAAKAEALAERVTHEMTLYSDAKSRTNRFGITDADGNPIWYGLFFGMEGEEQSAAEMAAAKKAVWLAGQVASKYLPAGSTVSLKLYVDAEWLTWANSTGKQGGKAKALKWAAEKAGIQLRVKWVSGTDNPADEYTVCGGYKKWSDHADLAKLAIAKLSAEK